MYLVRVTGAWDSWLDTDPELILVLRELDRAGMATTTDALLVRSGISAAFELEIFWKVGVEEMVARTFELVVMSKKKGDDEMELGTFALSVVIKAADVTVGVSLEPMDESKEGVLV